MGSPPREVYRGAGDRGEGGWEVDLDVLFGVSQRPGAVPSNCEQSMLKNICQLHCVGTCTRFGRHELVSCLLAASATFATNWESADAGAANRKPNVIFILANDLGYADVGFQGCKDVPTPHLDALAMAGMRCTNGYVSCPVCGPSRAGILTGRYQQRFGFEFNLGPYKTKNGLPVEQKTIADLLRPAGYATMAIGKWHLGLQPEFHPLARGFTEFYGFLGGARSFLPVKDSVGVPFAPKDPDVTPIFRERIKTQDPPYLTDAFGDEAVAFIDRHKDEPFFLYLAFNAVHVPLQATDKYLNRFPDIPPSPRRTFAAMLSSMDDAVGRIMAKLSAENLDTETLIFFLSDNGGHPPINASGNNPLRGEKTTVFEGGIRVPFVVKWTGRIPAGQLYSQPVISLDFLPTALAAAGIEKPTDLQIDGVDLLPALAGQTDNAPHKTLYWRFGDQGAIRHGNWKLTLTSGEPVGLYDLSQDLSETTDRSAAFPRVVEELIGLYTSWNANLEPPRWRIQSDGGLKKQPSGAVPAEN